MTPRRTRAATWIRPLVGVTAPVVAYFAVPLDENPSAVATGVAVVVTFTGVAALAWAITGQVRRHLRGEEQLASLKTLAQLVVLAVVVFALGYALLDRADPTQIDELDTRVDSLYFTLSTLATVGFGDISADGQLARTIVTVQIVFNLVFVAGLVSVLSGRIEQTARQPRE
jgi:hypothetical protein